MLSDLGIKQCVVRSERGHEPAFLNTAWTIQVLQGALLWLAALGVSLLIRLADQMDLLSRENVYADTMLPSVVGVLSIVVFIAGLGSTKLYEASRNLTLGRVAQIEIVSQLVGLFCMLVWVSIDRSIWALVAGAISSTMARTCLSHAWLPGPANRWQWDRVAVAEIIGFGKWMMLSSIFGFLVNNGDRLLLGGLVDTTMLGVYAIAYLLFSAIEQVLGTLVGEITFPALSEMVRERRQEAQAAYYRLHAVVAGLAYFSAGLLMSSGQAFVHVLYDSRYAQAGWMLQMLAAALLTIPARLTTQYFLAVGQPHLFSMTIGVRLVTLFIAVPSGFLLFGFPGALAGIVLGHFSYVPAIIFYSVKNKLFDVRKEFAVLPVIALGIGAGLLINLALRQAG
jgi:O-antigen/teichoic acid export membrane protein